MRLNPKTLISAPRPFYFISDSDRVSFSVPFEYRYIQCKLKGISDLWVVARTYRHSCVCVPYTFDYNITPQLTDFYKRGSPARFRGRSRIWGSIPAILSQHLLIPVLDLGLLYLTQRARPHSDSAPPRPAAAGAESGSGFSSSIYLGMQKLCSFQIWKIYVLGRTLSMLCHCI